MSEDCLYHRDRYLFAEIEKELRHARWIPRSHIHRLAMAVCCCRKLFLWDANRDADPTILDTYIRTITDNLDNDKETGMNLISPKLQMFLKYVIGRVTATDKSSCRLLEILCLARSGDWSYLTKHAISNNEVEEAKRPAGKQRLTGEQVQFIIRKKKRRMETSVIKLPMFPGNSSRLETKLGTTLDDFSKRNKCFLKYERGMNDTSMNANKNETFVRIWSSNPVAFKDTRSILMRTAMQVQEQIQHEKEVRKAMKRQRREMMAASEEDDVIDRRVLYEVKDWLSDDYAKKSWQAFGGRSRRGERKAQQSVLAGGHCLNCLASFNSLKTTSECRYHSGYPVSRDGAFRWSCCDAESNSLLAEDHTNFGCSTDVTHAWRTHKKASRKPERYSPEREQSGMY